ncbi:MAG: hypothetical protein JKY96_09365 [Phycisphaerales bacterium]|nr:hypothetical protein [Phycisphaerales bacterium]
MFSKTTRKTSFAATAGLAFLASTTSAHITVLEPNSGGVYNSGEFLTIQWGIDIRHNQQNWDIWYSTESSTGSWIELAMDLEPGNTSVNSIHTYDWLLPDINAEDVWIRVRMDNAGTDYFDVSNASFSIVPAPGPVSFFAIASVMGLRRRSRK